MSSCIETSRLVHNGGYIPKLLQLLNSPEILWFERLCLVTRVLLNLDRFYSILATIQCFKSAILDQFVTFCIRVYNTWVGMEAYFREKLLRGISTLKNKYEH